MNEYYVSYSATHLGQLKVTSSDAMEAQRFRQEAEDEYKVHCVRCELCSSESNGTGSGNDDDDDTKKLTRI